MILKTSVNYGGRIFAVGENVAGKIPLEYLGLLRENGHLEEEEQQPEQEVIEPSGSVIDVDAAAGEVVKQVKEVESLEELDRLLQLENEKPSPRSSVLKAIEKRYAELENSQTLGSLGGLLDE